MPLVIVGRDDDFEVFILGQRPRFKFFFNFLHGEAAIDAPDASGDEHFSLFPALESGSVGDVDYVEYVDDLFPVLYAGLDVAGAEVENELEHLFHFAMVVQVDPAQIPSQYNAEGDLPHYHT